MKRKYKVFVPVLADQVTTCRYDIEYDVVAESPEVALDLAIAASIPGTPDHESVEWMDSYYTKDIDVGDAENVAIYDGMATVHDESGDTLLERQLEYQSFPSEENDDGHHDDRLDNPDDPNVRYEGLVASVRRTGYNLGKCHVAQENGESFSEHLVLGEGLDDLLRWIDGELGTALSHHYTEAYYEGENDEKLTWGAI